MHSALIASFVSPINAPAFFFRSNLLLLYKQTNVTEKHPKTNKSDMHRVLSYQTAMQINDDRDIRTYITKRTCVSLIFSASFFTLIIGKHFSMVFQSFSFCYSLKNQFPNDKTKYR